VETFAQFSFPRLTDIDFQFTHFDEIGNELFEMIMANNPNIEKLAFDYRSYFSASGMIYEKLRELHVRHIDRQQISRLIGRCPNLLRFKGGFHLDYIDNDIWNEFFGQCPELEAVDINSDVMGKCLDFFEIESFWRLSAIKYLKLRWNPEFSSHSSDDYLTKIATSFPHITKLILGDVCPTNRGLGALAVLQSLHTIKFYGGPCGDLNASIIQWAQGKRLREIQIFCWITPITLVTLVRKCSNLEKISVNRIQDVNTAEAAAEVMQSIGRYHDSRKRKLDIILSHKNVSVWESKEVNLVLKDLNESMGLNISILRRPSVRVW